MPKIIKNQKKINRWIKKWDKKNLSLREIKVLLKGKFKVDCSIEYIRIIVKTNAGINAT